MGSCEELHGWANSLPAFRFPFEAHLIPKNGMYVLFERGEAAHGTNRIVRVGTHTGVNQLRSRLRQHFLIRNKDRSIFRKNVGRAILARANDPFLFSWELDSTSLQARSRHGGIDLEYQKEIEAKVSAYIQDSFTFCVIDVADKADRLRFESRMISTVSLCDICRPSDGWLGLSSPKDKIRESGLWLVNELYKQPLSAADFERLKDRWPLS